ncbi:MAG: 2Fe-2S iron-sulfur cluster binding domain-containing protein [Bradyrhizobium sp.]
MTRRRDRGGALCEQGICGTCEVRLMEGEADHRDSILSAAERASNEL